MDQAFPPSYNLATPPLIYPLSTVSKLDRRPTERLSKKDNLLTGEGGGGEVVGQDPNRMMARKPGPL